MESVDGMLDDIGMMWVAHVAGAWLSTHLVQGGSLLEAL